MYNLTVAGTHTHFVRAGGDRLWVHNGTCDPTEGGKWRTEPETLEEQMAKKGAESGAGEPIMEGEINDLRYKGTHTKMKYSETLRNGKTIEIHYWRNNATGEGSGFKFKLPPTGRPPFMR